MFYGRPAYGVPMMGNRGIGIDVNGDGITDYRIRPGVGIDVDGDGIADYRTGPRITPDIGAGFMNPYGY